MTFLSEIKELFGSGEPASGPRIVVFGDSHTAALVRAKEFPERSHLYERIKILRLRKHKDGRIVGDTELRAFCRHIRRYNEDDFVFSAIGGNQYTMVSTIKSPLAYDFLSSATDEDIGNDEAELIPHRAIASYIDSGVRGTDAPVLREIRDSTRAKVLHLLPPPPKEQNDFIVKQFESRFDEGMKQFGPTGPDLRLKAWTVQADSLARLCHELGIEPVPPPTASVTAQGFLQPRCYAEDVTHGNRRYGELVLKQILHIVDSSSASSGQ